MGLEPYLVSMAIDGFILFINFFKYETIETHARAYLTLIILAIGRPGYGQGDLSSTLFILEGKVII